MQRPHTILWVDDEVESLAAHVLFLEEHGYAVVGEIRAIDPSIPLVMVTKSEGPEIMREAIGIEMGDYLVKPVNPRQVLSVITRLVEGQRIREQRVARDFVTRFRELEQRRGARLGWREWIELVAEVAQWEARLGQGGQEGLRDALASLTRSLHADFAEYVRTRYPKWLLDASGDRPPLSPDVLPEFLAPLLRAHGKALFVLVDCLRLDQWELLRPLITDMFDVEVSHYFSILPTATPFARNAIFAGLFPVEIAVRHPEWWGERDDESLNAHEAELLAEQMAEIVSPRP